MPKREGQGVESSPGCSDKRREQSGAICSLNLGRRTAQLSRMPPSSKSTRVAEVTRPLLAVVLLGQWLLLLAFSSSEKLHHSICDQSKQPAHDCVFASIAKSQLLLPLDTVQAPLARKVEINPSIQRNLPLRSCEDFRLPPNRGPPSDPTST
jgi:hypothetical protein